MLLRRPLSALLRPLLAASASPAASIRRRPGFVSPFCTSVGTMAPACLDQLEVLRLRLEKERGICIGQLFPGKEHREVCPECGGGASKEISFALRVLEDGCSAIWVCHRAKCGSKGRLQAFGESKSPITSNIVKELKMNSTLKRHPIRIAQLTKPPKIITEEGLQLQPLCPELFEYFSSRMISPETLRRNGVRQTMRRNEVLTAFTYKRNKKLVGCKYRGPDKYFSQVAGCERIFYGLDDIERASEIIIVEGEMDKLAMEEAGYRNCVSVPAGAPAKVSKVVPSEKEDTRFRFLHNCKEYLDKASRIIIATDSDPPGQALAEELARRLGKERCWRVKWPSGCKDANEVLMFKDRDTLKELIVNAEM